jgi:hypothetical protein
MLIYGLGFCKHFGSLCLDIYYCVSKRHAAKYNICRNRIVSIRLTGNRPGPRVQSWTKREAAQC